MRHERVASPFTRTVHAPQTPCSQPACAPVRSSSSRRKSSTSIRGSTRTSCSTPLTVTCRRTFSGIRGSFPGVVGRVLHGPAGHDDGEVTAVVGRAVGGARGAAPAGGGGRGGGDRVLRRLGAGERLLDGGRPDRRGAHAAQRDPRPRD